MFDNITNMEKVEKDKPNAQVGFSDTLQKPLGVGNHSYTHSWLPFSFIIFYSKVIYCSTLQLVTLMRNHHGILLDW